MKDVFILGGGIAGLSAAIALRQKFPKKQIVVIERNEKNCEVVGHGMLLMPNAVRALRTLGADSFVLDGCRLIEKAVLQSENGHVTKDMPGSVYCTSRENFVKGLEKRFSELCSGDACSRIDYQKKCSKVTLLDGYVTSITFQDDTSLAIDPEDLLICAGGVRSVLWSTLNPEITRPASQVYELVTSTYAPSLAKELGGQFQKTVLSVGLAFGLLAPNSTNVIGLIQFDTKRHAIPTAKKQYQALFDKAVSLIHYSCQNSTPYAAYASIVDLDTAHVWCPTDADLADNLCAKNAVLCGDAAHPLLPFTSQGCRAALEDAVTLAETLDRCVSPGAVQLQVMLKEFVKMRGKDVQKYIVGGREILRDFLEHGAKTQAVKLPYVLGTGDAGKLPIKGLFHHDNVDLVQLKRKAYNYRWAVVEDDVIPLTAADSDFPIAKHIRDALIDYVVDGHMHYGPPCGLPELREAIANKYGPMNPEQVFVTNAAASSMFLVMQHLLKPGDQVVFADPMDFLFQRAVENAGGVVRRYSLRPPGCNGSKHWTFDIKDIEALITSRTKVLGICNPHNPVGRVWTEKELLQMADLACRYNLAIWSDEVWADISYVPAFSPTRSISQEIASRTYTVLGFSKGYGLAGMRLGAILAPSCKAVRAISKLSLAEDTAYGVPVLSQVAGIAALQRAHAWQQEFVAHVKLMCAYAVNFLNQIPHVFAAMPEGTFVCFINVSYYLAAAQMTEEELVQYLAQEARVAVVPGSPAFFGPGAAGHIRVSVATSIDVLAEALDRIKKGLTGLCGSDS